MHFSGLWGSIAIKTKQNTDDTDPSYWSSTQLGGLASYKWTEFYILLFPISFFF